MASRFMFLVQRRGGSQLVNRLLGQVDDSICLDGKAEVMIRTYPVLPVEESVTYIPLYQMVPEIIAGVCQDYSLEEGKSYAFCLYAEASGYDPSQDLYQQSLPSWSAPQLQQWLPSPVWKVFSTVRDGREHIVSLLRGEHNVEILSGEEGDFDFLADMDKFQELCYEWKWKARLNLDSQRVHPHFKILKFEDAVQDPLGFLDRVLRDCGLTPKLKPISLKIRTSSTWIPASEPQGSEVDIMDRRPRYECLEKRHWDLYRQILLPELAELGYTGQGIDD